MMASGRGLGVAGNRGRKDDGRAQRKRQLPRPSPSPSSSLSTAPHRSERVHSAFMSIDERSLGSPQTSVYKAK